MLTVGNKTVRYYYDLLTEMTYDPFYDRAAWELSFAWFPHRCEITNRLIWLTRAYQGTRIITGPGEPVVEQRWHNKHQHLLWCLKGN
jgi:hypothetical protein